MKLELLTSGSCDDGEYIGVAVGAGKVEAEIHVEDGVFGRKVRVTAGDRTETLELD